jgi:hypothetical protein
VHGPKKWKSEFHAALRYSMTSSWQQFTRPANAMSRKHTDQIISTNSSLRIIGSHAMQCIKYVEIFRRNVVALVYNWWSLFVRLANPKARLEAITSRPFLLSGVARKTDHAGQQHLAITGMGSCTLAHVSSVSLIHEPIVQVPNRARNIAVGLPARMPSFAFVRLVFIVLIRLFLIVYIVLSLRLLG